MVPKHDNNIFQVHIWLLLVILDWYIFYKDMNILFLWYFFLSQCDDQGVWMHYKVREHRMWYASIHDQNDGLV